MDLRLLRKKSTLFWVTWALRGSAALALTVASFVALRQRYHGSCVIPGDGLGDPEFTLFLVFPALFLIGFVWSLSELAYPLHLVMGIPDLFARLDSIALGLSAYAIVGCAAWLISPVPEDVAGDQAFRAFMSAFWNAGFLVKTGNFSAYSCGY